MPDLARRYYPRGPRSRKVAGHLPTLRAHQAEREKTKREAQIAEDGPLNF